MFNKGLIITIICLFALFILIGCSPKQDTISSNKQDLERKYGPPISVSKSNFKADSEYIQFQNNTAAQVDIKTGKVEGEFREPKNNDEKSLNYWKRKFKNNKNHPQITYTEIKSNNAISGLSNFELRSEDEKTGETVSVIYSSYKKSVIRIVYYGKK